MLKQKSIQSVRNNWSMYPKKYPPLRISSGHKIEWTYFWTENSMVFVTKDDNKDYYLNLVDAQTQERKMIKLPNLINSIHSFNEDELILNSIDWFTKFKLTERKRGAYSLSSWTFWDRIAYDNWWFVKARIYSSKCWTDWEINFSGKYLKDWKEYELNRLS